MSNDFSSKLGKELGSAVAGFRRPNPYGSSSEYLGELGSALQAYGICTESEVESIGGAVDLFLEGLFQPDGDKLTSE